MRRSILQHTHGVPWTPQDMRSAVLVGFVDFEDNSKITTVSGGISQILDTRSGGAFVQGTAGSRPALVTSASTGRQVASFDGADDELTYTGIPTGWPTSTTAGGIFAVVNQIEDSGVTRIAFGYGGASTSSNRSILKVSGTLARGNADGAASTNSVVSFLGRRFVLVNVASTLNCEVDSVLGTDAAATLATGTVRGRIGAGTATSAANFYIGEISAVGVWTGTLSAMDKTLLYSWARTRLGY